MPRLLVFNRSYPPDGGATGRLLADLCEDLVARHGWKVTVVAGPPTGAPASAAGNGRAPNEDRRGGVTVVRAWGTQRPKGRFADRAANYLSYFASASLAGIRLARPDVVMCLTDPPILGLAALAWARRWRVPFVFLCQDVFPEVATLLEDFRSDRVNQVLDRVNRLLLQRADGVVAIGETMAERLVAKGANPARLTVIHNWADRAILEPGPKKNPFAEAHGLADRFVVLHSGNLGLSQGLEHLVGAAALLRDLPDLMLVFQGDGVKRHALEAQARALGLENVRFLPYASRDELRDAFAAADLQVVSLRRGLAGFIVPSKLYGILAAGRPYVAAVEENGEVDVITRRHDCGVLAEPGNAQHVAQAIRALHGDRGRTARLGANARAASTLFDRRLQVRRYLEVFQSVLGASEAEPSDARVGEPARSEQGVGIPALRPARGVLSEVDRTAAKPR